MVSTCRQRAISADVTAQDNEPSWVLSMLFMLLFVSSNISSTNCFTTWYILIIIVDINVLAPRSTLVVATLNF